MEWNAYQAERLAHRDCGRCAGTGLPPASVVTADRPLCDCVCRSVFRVCYRRFRRCVEADASARNVTFREMPRGVDRRLVWARRNEDYIADFEAAARRVLSPALFSVFRLYHLLGAAPDLLARRIGASRRGAFQFICDVEIAVGRELAHMRPYSLYPPGQYWSGGAAPVDKCKLSEIKQF